MTEPTALTFETGYDRLTTISERVNSEDVPVAEMCDLFAEGKGLETALTAYLDEQKSRVEAIERGEGIKAFRIVAPAEMPGDERDGERDFTPRPPGAELRPAAPPSNGAGDDDIPF